MSIACHCQHASSVRNEVHVVWPPPQQPPISLNTKPVPSVKPRLQRTLIICSSFSPLCISSCILLSSTSPLCSRKASIVLRFAYSRKLYAANWRDCRSNERNYIDWPERPRRSVRALYDLSNGHPLAAAKRNKVERNCGAC